MYYQYTLYPTLSEIKSHSFTVVRIHIVTGEIYDKRNPKIISSSVKKNKES